MTLYITSLSFEERCLALPSDIVASDETEKEVVLLDFSGYENVDPYLANRARIVQSLAAAKCSTRTFPVSLASPLDGRRQLEELIKESVRRESCWTYLLCLATIFSRSVSY